MKKAVLALVWAGTLGLVGPVWADQATAVAGDAAPKPGLTPVVTRSAALATIGSTTADSSGAAGAHREADAPTAGAATPTPKPAASLRMLRRIKADNVVASLQPAFKDCYARSDSRASGIVVVRAGAAPDGQVETVEIVSLGGLPLGLAQCVADRVHDAHFGAPGGSGVSLMVPARLGP
jgi:hypothetical protein